MNRDNRIKDDSFYLLKTVGRIQYTLLLYVSRNSMFKSYLLKTLRIFLGVQKAKTERIQIFTKFNKSLLIVLLLL